MGRRTPTPRTPARAEIVGSLLRPPELREAIDRAYAPGHRAMLAEERSRDRSVLHAAEDAAIRQVVGRQIDLGLDVVSDGEFRRYMFLNSFWDAVEGFSTDRNPVEFRGASGDNVTWHVQRVEERLRVVDSPAAAETEYLSRVTRGHPFKVTFPAASLFAHPFTFRPPGAYRDLEELVEHCITIERGLIADAVNAGARYVQLDFPLYPYLVDPWWSEQFASKGVDLERLLSAAIRADNAVIADVPPEVTTALHVCRGNYRSRWLCEGSLEPVAERMFGELQYDRYLIEWDDTQRDGSYDPIRFVRPGKTVVMGLISSKSADVEDEEDIVRRMEVAGHHLAMEQMALSPQCGFASVMEGNEISEDAQWRKLELVSRVANRLWHGK
jgi:5-methyltetrahydropteroyltriglutamate--homocysteine methyltransferase